MAQEPVTISNYDAVGQMAPRPVGYDDGTGEVQRVSEANPLPVVPVSGSSADVPYEYETVAAGSTDQQLGASGAIGDYLSHLIIVPAAAACGAVSMKDGSGSAISLFVGGGTVPLPILAPIVVYVGLLSLSGGWKITTGADVSIIAAGNFS